MARQHLSSAHSYTASGMLIKAFVLFCFAEYLIHCHILRHRLKRFRITGRNALHTFIAQFPVYLYDSFIRKAYCIFFTFGNAVSAADTVIWKFYELLLEIYKLWIMTPSAPQRTSLQ